MLVLIIILDHFEGIFKFQFLSIFQIENTIYISSVFLFYICDHVETNVRSVNPLDHHQTSPFTDFSPIGKFHIQLIFSNHFCQSTKVVCLQTSEQKIDLSVSVLKLFVEFDIIEPRTCPDTVFNGFMNIINFFGTNDEIFSVSEIINISLLVTLLQKRKIIENLIVAFIVFSIW